MQAFAVPVASPYRDWLINMPDFRLPMLPEADLSILMDPVLFTWPAQRLAEVALVSPSFLYGILVTNKDRESHTSRLAQL